MDFDPTPEHVLLRDSLRRALADPLAPGEASLWPRCVELGLAALDCRADAAADDLQCMMIAQEELGRALAAVPFVATVVHAAALLRAAGTPAQHESALACIERGEATLALALAEERSRYARPAPGVQAVRRDGTWQLDGELAFVSEGDRADGFLIAATHQGAPTLLLVPANAPGLARTPVARLDGHGAADVHLRGVMVPDSARVGPEGGAHLLLESVERMGIVAEVAEAVGCMDALLALTVEYLKTRRQFGRPLGDFQALKHRAADMYVAVEQARSLMYFATLSCAMNDPVARARAVAAAKVQAARSARFVGQQAIQLHGGIGLAEEYRAGHYFRRLTALELAHGDADDHLAALGGMGGLFAAADA